MGRWSDGHIWNDGTLWGSAHVPRTDRRLSWFAGVDWDNDQVFDGESEAENMFNLEITRGRLNFLQSSGQGFENPQPGQLRIELRDPASRYNPFNTSSPLAGQLTGSQRVKVKVLLEETGTLYDVFYGYISNIQPNYGDPPTATLYAEDAIVNLKQTSAKTSQVYTTKQFDEAIIQILLDIGWADGTDIATNMSDTMAYWWGENDAYSELMDLVQAALGYFFIAANGNAKYIGRIALDESVATFTDAVGSVTGDALREYGIRSPSPREVLKNKIRVFSRSRQSNADVELWRAVDKPLVPAGTTITVWASFNYSGQAVPATSVTTPVATTDYTANSQVGGGGTNLTSSISIVMTPFASAAKQEITNSSATDAYMTLLKLRGTAITVDPYSYAEDSDATSIASFGEREFIVKTNWLQDLNTAIEHAGLILAKLKDLRQYPRFKVRNKPAKQFLPDVFSLITLDFAQAGISGEYRIGYIRHEWAQRNGDIVDTVFHCEPNLASATSGTWIFPATFGTTTVFG